MTAAPPAVLVEGVTKSFGYRWALRGINLEVKEGTFLALFGPNGAGKTTLLKILAALSRPTSGRIWVQGKELSREASLLRRHIGFLSHQPLLYDELTVEENLHFYGRMFSLTGLEAKIDSLLSQVGLEERRHQRVRTLSHGLQKRASIARALLHNPSLLLLDEPESGLDEEATERLWTVLAPLASSRRTVVMATHNLEWGLRLAGEVAIVAGGRVAYHGPKDTLDPEAFRHTYKRYTIAAR